MEMNLMDWWHSVNAALATRNQPEMTFGDARDLYEAAKARIARRKLQEARFALTTKG